MQGKPASRRWTGLMPHAGATTGTPGAVIVN